MIEVEIRSKINNREEIKKRLQDMDAKFIKNVRQIDKIYGHPNFLDENNFIIDGGVVPRIRAVNNTNTLEFKEIVREGGGFEIKADLPNIDIGIEFLQKLGFNEAFTLDKSRDYYTYNDFEICVDDVKTLGSYIEVEKNVLTPEEKDQAREDCLNLLKKISPDLTVEPRKYGDLIQEKINQSK